MKKLLNLITAAVLTALPLSVSQTAIAAAAPAVTITGVVLDEGGLPIPGAFLVGADNSNAVTDIDGKFSIKVASGVEITVSFMGYIPYKFKATEKQNVKIVLKEDMQSLEESVVVGYGTQKKAVITGSVSNISDKAIATTTSNDLVSKLQGKVSGLNIRNNTGTPGGYDSSINIRGFGTPLYIIDGINRTATDFYRMNSEDIQSISVLKDASAAIYGLNAANGVVIVTTKEGNNYGKPRFQFNANVGFSSPTDRVKMADGYTYYYLRNAANINAGDPEYISAEELEKWRTGEYSSTDWYGATFKNTSVRQEYSLSADGGGKGVKYYMNVNYSSDGGLLKSGDINYNKWSFRSNVSAKMTQSVTASINISGFMDKSENPAADMFNIYRGTVTSLPYKTVYANNTEPYWNGVKDGQAYNPVAQSYIENCGYKRQEINSLQTVFSVDYSPEYVKGFQLKGTVSFDKRWTKTKGLRKNWKMYTYDSMTDTYASEDWNPLTKITNNYNNLRNITYQVQANYKRDFAKDHHLGVSAIFEARQSDNDYDSIEKYFDFYTNDQIDYAGDKDAKSGGNESHTRNMSFIGRLTYDYKSKYLLEAAVRRDGSYRYHPDVRWGTFPVFSAGWRISEESWMQWSKKVLSNLKLRGSYGIIGEDAGSAFQYIYGYTVSGGGWWEYNPEAATIGVSTPSLVNEHLTWTKSYISDIGIDLGFFDNTLTFTFDIFRKDKTGILASRNVDVPNTFGATFPQENLNSNRTEGFEFSLGYQGRIGEFFYNINGNATYGRTKNLHIEHSPYTNSWSEYRSGSENRWNDLAWVYTIIGQFQSEEEIQNYAVYSTTLGNKRIQPGDWIYEDVNGDGVIDGDDTRPVSLSAGRAPVWNYGLTIGGSWRGIDFSLLFQGAAGFVTFYSGPYAEPFWQDGNIPEYYLDSWHHADPFDSSSEWVAGSLPSIRNLTNDPYRNWASAMTYKDCSYVRLKNLELGYTFNQKFLQKAKIEKIRVFVNANNVFTICDKYVKAYDPEKVAGSNNVGWNYPILRTINAGVNFNF